ncbi:hypothetical protein ABZ815_10535 [Nonomuraea sp. NPDC047529]|uniref:hypothetical protein n=1 Tax=Nonomuraea sp. NPDC047529 TaxID=3155623 RepID=UPI0033D9D949
MPATTTLFFSLRPVSTWKSGLSIDETAQLCGHAGTTVTKTVFRHQIRPVIQTGAPAMDRIFDGRDA